MRYSLEKYKFFQHPVKKGIEIIAMSTYGGKTVKGKAICHPDDAFDEETGKKIAAARCNLKIANKRAKRAKAQYEEATKAYVAAYKRVKDMEQYYDDAVAEAAEGRNHLISLLDELDNK